MFITFEIDDFNKLKLPLEKTVLLVVKLSIYVKTVAFGEHKVLLCYLGEVIEERETSKLKNPC